MNGVAVVRHLVLVLALGTAAAAQAFRFTPPRLVKTELPPVPSPMVVGGGEVLVEALVDARGFPTRPTVLRGTPPYTQMVLDALARWHFEPARATDDGGREIAVEMPITVAAVFRPPTLYNMVLPGEPPRDFSRPSAEVAYPLTLPTPAFPPNAVMGAVVMYELLLDQAGRITESRSVQSVGGYEGVARDALGTMQFRGASYRARPVPARAYVLFGFRPVTSPCNPPATVPVPPTSPFPPPPSPPARGATIDPCAPCNPPGTLPDPNKPPCLCPSGQLPDPRTNTCPTPKP